MSVSKLLAAWRAEPSISDNIMVWRDIPARPAQSVPLPARLHPALSNALQIQGIQRLYAHQALSWDLLAAGKHIVVETGTASGKSLCYNLAILDRLLHDPNATALLLFPTKALAQDQAAALRLLIEAIRHWPPNSPDLASPTGDFSSKTSLPFDIYDGDTPANQRPSIRAKVRILLSNPDMLHIGVLPHHTAWARFLRSLQFVVLDEAHIYRGVFGSHLANLIRRLKRIAAFYGSHPQFILTSATIANPAEFSAWLVEEDVVLVDQDGAARGRKHFLIYNPPVIDRDLGLRRSALQESVRLAEDLMAYDVQTIIFGGSRRTIELVLAYLRERSRLQSTDLEVSAFTLQRSESQFIRGYRSGYLPAQRREIEHGLRQGDVRLVVATNALELGIDIGGMGAALLVGYPGSIAATWQQAGRSGRGTDPAVAIMVVTSDPLDQFLASHPEYFFGRSPEHALVNPDNLLILLDHLRCAAFELPFKVGEPFGRVGSENVAEFLAFLEEQGVLHHSGLKYFWMADQYPAQNISLRSTSTSPVTLQTRENDLPVTIGQVDLASAYWMVHPRAIYLHEGQSYSVEELDLQQNIAWLRPVESDFYTLPRLETTIQLVEQLVQTEVPGAAKAYGEILVTSQVTGFRKVRWFTHEQLGVEDLEMPSTELMTTGYWLALNEETVERLRQEGLWRSDPNAYGPNWHRRSEQARRRDNFRCQVCGILELDRAHDVHHKVPFRTFSSVEEANRLENLVTLCPPCHRRAEAAVRVRSGLAGLSFVLKHLAPFFLMCDTRDLGVQSDPQSPLANGRPAIVVYDQIPAGIGLSQRLFELHDDLLARSRELVQSCSCNDGCPSCVGPGGENGLGGKLEALALLAILMPS